MFIDATLALLIFFACTKGLKKGAIIALFSLVAYIAGLVAALKLSAVVATKLSAHAGSGTQWLPLVSFLLVFIAVVLLVNMAGKILEQTAEMVMLGWINKLAGAGLYIVIYGLIFSVFLFYAVKMNFITTENTKASMSYPYLEPLAPRIMGSAGSILPLFRDMFSQLEAFFDAVSHKLQH